MGVNDRKEVPIVPGGPNLTTVAKIGASIAMMACGAGPAAMAIMTTAFTAVDVASGNLDIEHALVQTGISFAAAGAGGLAGSYGTYVTQGVNSAAGGIEYKDGGGIGWSTENFTKSMRQGILTMGINAGLGQSGLDWNQHVTTGISTFVGSSVSFGNRLDEISWDYDNWDTHLVAGGAAMAASYVSKRSTTAMTFNNDYEGTFTSAHYFNKSVNNLVENSINAAYAMGRHGVSFEQAMAQTNFWDSLMYDHKDVGGWLGSNFAQSVKNALEEQPESKKATDAPGAAPGPPGSEDMLNGLYLSRKREEGNETGEGLDDTDSGDQEMHVDNAGVLAGEPPRSNPQEEYTQENMNVYDVLSSLTASDKSLSTQEGLQKVCDAFGVESASDFKEQIKDMPIEEIQEAVGSLTSGMSDAQKAKFINNLGLGMAMRSGDVVRQGTVWIDKATGKKVANVRSDVLQKEYQEKVTNDQRANSYYEQNTVGKRMYEHADQMQKVIDEQLYDLRNPSLDRILGKEDHLFKPEYNDYKYDTNYTELRPGDPNSMPPIDHKAVAEREEWLREQEEQRRIQEIYAKNDSYIMSTVGVSGGFKYLGVSAWGSVEIGVVGETQLQPGWASVQNYVDETGLSDDVKNVLKGVIAFTAFANGAGGLSDDTKIIGLTSSSTSWGKHLAFSDFIPKSTSDISSFGYNLDASIFTGIKHGQGFENTSEALNYIKDAGYDLSMGPVTLNTTISDSSALDKKWQGLDFGWLPGGGSLKTINTINKFTKYGISWNRTWTNYHILYE